jgi:hypothetical protein
MALRNALDPPCPMPVAGETSLSVSATRRALTPGATTVRSKKSSDRRRILTRAGLRRPDDGR